MTTTEVDAYIDARDEPARSLLTAIRRLVLAALPDGEEGISYGAPVVRVGGQAIAGFSAAKRHVSYLPHSGTVLGALDPDLLAGFETTKGALKLPFGTEPPTTFGAAAPSQLRG